MEHLPQDYKTLDTYSGSSVLLWQELILCFLCLTLYLFKFQFKKDDSVFQQSSKHEDNARNDPTLDCSQALSLKREYWCFFCHIHHNNTGMLSII